MELFLYVLIETAKLDKIFGEGNWVVHVSCPETQQPYIIHHKYYHVDPRFNKV